MSTAVQHAPLVSADDYLAAEMEAERKHEYLNGVVCGMAGATERHNDLVMNIAGTLHARLRGSSCRPYASDMLLRVERGQDQRFYYPDVLIVCRPAGPKARVQSEPSVIFEVLSESAERIDTGEKRMAYLTVPTLEAYVIVDADRREVTVWRQTAGQWAPEILTAADAILEFASANCSLSVEEIYEGTEL